MIKAYFFDWIDTLGTVDNENHLKEILGTQHKNLLTTKNFNDLTFDHTKQQLAYNELINAKFSLFDDSERVIKNLRNGYSLGIVSNVYCITNELIRKQFQEFLSNFDIITFSSEIGIKKPQYEIFTRTLKSLNKLRNLDIKPSEVMMIGDKYKNDIAPALDLGMQAKLIDRTKQNLEDVL